MARRVHVPTLSAGRVALPPAEAHHVRDVLRLAVGEELELFDAAGRRAAGRIASAGSDGVAVDVGDMEQAIRPAGSLTVAAAVPKGDRADWMVEKLSELGVARFVPVVADRSVVVPAGRSKAERWGRLAIESAKQCRRAGVMAVGPVTAVADVVGGGPGWVLSTGDAATPAIDVDVPVDLTVLVGPEGGWTDAELAACAAAGWRAVGLGPTVLRVETAAVAVAAVVACRRASSRG